MKTKLLVFLPVIVVILIYSEVYAQNTLGESDDYSRIAIAPVVTEKSNLPAGSEDVLTGKMRQIISLNGLSAMDDAPLFIMYPEMMVISDEVTATTPPMRAYNLEVVFSLADKYTGNVYASTTEALKGVGKTETAAYNAAFKQINVRSGKFKVMLEKGKEGIIEYYNTHCDLVISRARSLAAQGNYKDALAMLNSVPPVSRECFDKANAVAAEIGESMPDQNVAVSPGAETDEQEPVYSSNQTVELGNNIFLRYKNGKTIGDKTFLYFELINKNEEDFNFEIHNLHYTMLINEKGEEVNIELMTIGSKQHKYNLEATLIPDVNTEMICQFPKVKEVKFIKFGIFKNTFKFKNLPLGN